MHLQTQRLFPLLLQCWLALLPVVHLQTASLNLHIRITENTTADSVLLNLSQAVAQALSLTHQQTASSGLADCQLDFSLLIDEATPSSEQRFVLRNMDETAGGGTALVLKRAIDVDAFPAKRGSHVFELEVLLETSGRRKASAAASSSCRIGALLPHTVRVFVNVTDVNDNAPQFPTPPQGALTVAFNEADSNGTRVPLPLAHDPDSGSNSVVNYSLRVDPRTDEAALFRLQVVLAAQPGTVGGPASSHTPDRTPATPTPYLVLIGKLDRERRDRYSVTLVATDGGGLKGEAVVAVRVDDANDNAPVFDKAIYSVRVGEDMAVGQELVTVRATDPDVETLVSGETGAMQYAVKPTSIPISAASTCGSTAGTSASASHRGELSTAALVAFDPERPGRLLLREPLDHEAFPRFEVLVTATDRGTPALTATATVRVEVCSSAFSSAFARIYLRIRSLLSPASTDNACHNYLSSSRLFSFAHSFPSEYSAIMCFQQRSSRNSFLEFRRLLSRLTPHTHTFIAL